MQLPTSFSTSSTPSSASFRSPKFSTSLILLLTLAPSLATCLSSFDCDHVRVKGKSYDFSSLSGPHSVSVIEEHPPSVKNRTWTVDLCKSMKPKDGIPKEHQCPQATRVCGIETTTADNTTIFDEVRPIAGTDATYHRHLDPTWKVIPKAEDANDWRVRGGLALELHGGWYEGKEQMAVIDFACDPDRSGNEGNEDAVDRGKDGEMDGDSEEEKMKLARRVLDAFVAADDDKKKGKEGDEKDDDEDAMKNSLRFVSFGKEDSDKVDVLRLQWATKLVCRTDADDDGHSGWGFFTWFILILFMGTAAYLIFGSWLNYNRYGARGWDLLPHGDTIRDIPYLFRDWSRKVVDTIQGGHSRGGYSAV